MWNAVMSKTFDLKGRAEIPEEEKRTRALYFECGNTKG
jgi:hypothetical protein